MIFIIVYCGGRQTFSLFNISFIILIAAHRFSKTHYYIIKIQSYNNTNGQFINCPYNLVGCGVLDVPSNTDEPTTADESVSSTTVDPQIAQIVRINPILYRSYYYDKETGWYYLTSRFYSPELCRFINSDNYALPTVTPTELTDKNLFAYCDNNPITRFDKDGQIWAVAVGIGAAVGAVVGIAGQILSDMVTSALKRELYISNWQTYVGAVIGGAVGGAVLGATGNVALSNTVTGFATTGIGMSLEKVTGASDASWAEIGVNSVVDGATSYVLGKLPGVKKVTKGRNNHSAVYRGGLTKLRNGTARQMSKRVFWKGIKSTFISGLPMDAYYGLKKIAYRPMKYSFINYRNSRRR